MRDKVMMYRGSEHQDEKRMGGEAATCTRKREGNKMDEVEGRERSASFYKGSLSRMVI
jgi:hypothetical protein